MASLNGLPILGSISLLGFPFTMRGWAEADGALLPIAQHDALYSLFGNAYGGGPSPGATSFGLPKLLLPTLEDPESSAPPLSYQVSLNGIYPERS